MDSQITGSKYQFVTCPICQKPVMWEDASQEEPEEGEAWKLIESEGKEWVVNYTCTKCKHYFRIYKSNREA